MRLKLVSESETQLSSNYEDQLCTWRKKCFLRMGFSEEWSLALAEAKVDHHRVHAMLEHGCTHVLACSIML